MENYVIYRFLHRINDNTRFSLILLTTQSHLHFSFLIFNMELFKTNRGKPGILTTVLDLEKTGTQKRYFYGDM